jgi:N-acetylneuraminic acid mutarotase
MKKIIPLILIFSAGLHFLNAQYVWRHKACLPAEGRNCRLFQMGNYAYTIGGPGNTCEVWMYDPTSDSWSRKNNFPGASFGPVVFVINDTAYAGMGLDSLGNFHNDFWKYNATSDQWTSIPSMPGTGRYNGSTFVINGKGYAGFGYNWGGPFRDLYEYDPAGNTWSTKASAPAGGSLGFGLAAGNFGYVGLGWVNNTTILNTCYRYNPSADSWITIDTFPGGSRGGSVFFVLNDTFYVGAGGNNPLSDAVPQTFFSDLWWFNTSDSSWVSSEGFGCIQPKGNCAGGYFNYNGNAYVACVTDSVFPMSDLLEFGPLDTTFTSQSNILGNDTCYTGSFSKTLSVSDSCAEWSTGVNGSSITVNTFGTYWVRYNDSCGVWADTIKLSSCTGIETIAQDLINIYPNPLNTGNWQLTVPNELIGSIATIYDANGRMVYQSAIGNEQWAINGAFANGVYQLRIQTANGVVVRKLVKL